MPDWALILFAVIVGAALLVRVGWIAGCKRGEYDAMDKLYRGLKDKEGE